MSGIIGALSNNGAGIAQLQLERLDFAGARFGSAAAMSDILAAMLWSAGVHVDGVPDNPYPAKILNLSWRCGPCAASEQTVVNRLTALHVLIVASAGNEGGPVEAPANCSGVAAVAGIRHIGTKVDSAVSVPMWRCQPGG